jgi:hypothetical protein
MLDALVDGTWYPVARAYSDGVEVVTGHDGLDGQVVLRWLDADAVADYRLTPVRTSPPPRRR